MFSLLECSAGKLGDHTGSKLEYVWPPKQVDNSLMKVRRIATETGNCEEGLNDSELRKRTKHLQGTRRTIHKYIQGQT